MKEKMTKIAEFIQKNVKADDYEIYVIYNDTQHTRFAQNSITQHMVGDYIEVYYRCVKDKRLGTASTRQVDEENLLQLLNKAEEIALNNSPDPEIATTLAKGDYPKVNNYFPSIEKIDTPRIMDIIKKCIDNAEKKEGRLSGIFTKSTHELIYATGNGFSGYDKSSNIELSMTLSKAHIETNVAYSNKDFEKINVDGILAQLNEQFEALKVMKDMDYETIPVILRPNAVKELFGYFEYGMLDRKLADQGMSAFAGKLNEKCFGEKFSFSSRIDDNDLEISPFSQNNVSKTIDWVKNGVLLNLPTTRSWGQKNGLEPTNIFNNVFVGEGVSEKEMMKMVKRGLIINTLWYIRMNDMKTFDLTGMTRDGVMYFEDGEIKHAVNNFRFNEQIVEMTHRILATGTPVQLTSDTKVPSMLIDGFTFVDKTTF
jgi:predicted Zn-dependent protease